MKIFINAYQFGHKIIKINCERYFLFFWIFDNFKSFLEVKMTSKMIFNSKKIIF